MYINTTPTHHVHQQVQYHHLHHQQHQPSHVPSNHHPHYVQPIVMYAGETYNQHSSMIWVLPGSMQQQGPDSSPAHAAAVAGPYHIQQNVTTPNPAKLLHQQFLPHAGHVSNHLSLPAFPIAPDSEPGQWSPHQIPTASNQLLQYYQNYHAAAAPVFTQQLCLFMQQLLDNCFKSPSTTTATDSILTIRSTLHVQPQTQGQLYGRVGHQQAFQTQDRAG